MSSIDGRNVMAEPGPADQIEPDAIEASRVSGTPVYNTEGDHLGNLHDIVIGKRDGRVRYAVLSFGGFLGIGEDYRPLPWEILKYDERQGGYVIGVTIDHLKGAPSYGSESGFSAIGRNVDDYWKPAAV